ncbi:epoxide hydrolase N-terminal domain-containing protein [Microbacterium sp.]|uniref:epoxide hydrolase N-terminal domain-containing protein n=1 Tax=Microbacterium sp. TaxID=51671 RepID=UPI0039E218A0
MSEIHRFDTATIEDLRRRLAAVRWPDSPRIEPWSLGADVDELRRLISYWAEGFDFDAHRAAIEDLPSRRRTVGGLSTPSKPHSSRATVVSSHSFSAAGVPLMRLYDAISVAG